MTTTTEPKVTVAAIVLHDAYIATHINELVALAGRIDAYATQMAGEDALMGHALRADVVADLRTSADELRTEIARVRNAEPF